MDTSTESAAVGRRAPRFGERVSDVAGAEAVIEAVVEPPPAAPGAPARTEPMVALRGDDGQAYRLPISLLASDAGGGWQAQVALADVATAGTETPDTPGASPVAAAASLARTGGAAADGLDLRAAADGDSRGGRALDPSADDRVVHGGERLVVPVLEEALQVDKRMVDRGGWRITRSVDSREEIVDEPLVREQVHIERRAVDRLLPAGAAVPGVRHEGDAMIVPVLEEVLVVEKRLRLCEELVVRRERTEFRAPQRVLLRREQVSVDRIDPGEEARSDAASGPATDGRAS